MAVIIICFVVYGMYSSTGAEFEKIAMGFPTDKIGLTQVIDEKVDDLYKEMQVKAETAEEMSGDVENEEIEAMDAQMYAIQNVNLREGTAVTTTALRTIQFAEQVHVTGISTNKQWYQVEDAEKGTGYVASNCLSDTKPTQNSSEAQKENPEGTTDLTGATKPSGGDTAQKPSGGGSDNTGGGNTGGGNGLTPEQQAFLDSLGGGGYIPETPSAGEGGNGTGNHGITMAQ